MNRDQSGTQEKTSSSTPNSSINISTLKQQQILEKKEGEDSIHSKEEERRKNSIESSLLQTHKYIK
mgnify:CR=1 FL=1